MYDCIFRIRSLDQLSRDSDITGLRVKLSERGTNIVVQSFSDKYSNTEELSQLSFSSVYVFNCLRTMFGMMRA